jgi:hypothetical protein
LSANRGQKKQNGAEGVRAVLSEQKIADEEN